MYIPSMQYSGVILLSSHLYIYNLRVSSERERERKKIMELGSILFLFRILLELPIRIVWCYFSISLRVSYRRARDIGLLKRIFMREAFSLGEVSICKDVINPIFNALNYCILGKTLSIVGYRLTKRDHEFLRERFPEWKSGINESVTTRFWWYKRPKGFDPEIDPVLVVTHGGGYAIEFLPLNLVFLRRVSLSCPRMAIVIQRYTVTATSKSRYAAPLLQILETVALYEVLARDYSCKNIVAMGDSAGANVLLGTLQYLELTGRRVSLPRRIVLISPWCNPTCFPKGEIASAKKFELLDCLSFEGLKKFSQLIRLGANAERLDKTSLLNVERNYDERVWAGVLSRSRILIWAGSEEILQEQIKSFVHKLVATSRLSQDTNGNVIYSFGRRCGHIEPLLLFNPMSHSNWTQHPAIRPVLEFLHEESSTMGLEGRRRGPC